MQKGEVVQKPEKSSYHYRVRHDENDSRGASRMSSYWFSKTLTGQLPYTQSFAFYRGVLCEAFVSPDN